MRSSAIAVIGMLLLSSCLAGSSLIQTLKMQSKTPAHLWYGIHDYEVVGPGFLNGRLTTATSQWVIGGTDGKRVTDFWAKSTNDGKRLTGYVEYDRSGSRWPFFAYLKAGSTTNYYVWVTENGGANPGPWFQETNWILGGRSDKPLIEVSATGDGFWMSGKITYKGEVESPTVIRRLFN